MATLTNLVSPRLARMLAWFHFSQWTPWLVLVVSLGVTYGLWHSAQQEAGHKLQSDFDFRVHDAGIRIEQRMLAYIQVLRGVQGLFASSVSVERDEFHTYNDKLHLNQNYPGIQGVGFALLVPPAEKDKFISTIRKQGFPTFSIWPEGRRDILTTIIYVEPFSGRNLRPFGYDMYTEPVRRTAMEQARDTDEATLSSRIQLVVETGEQVQAGFKMFLPVYKNGIPHDTLAERRANLLGWVYGLFRMDDLMQGILGEHVNDIDIEIFDGDKWSEETLLYDANHIPNVIKKTDSHFQSIKKLVVAGHTWTIAISSLPGFEVRQDTRKSQLIATVGIGMSLLLALLVLLAAGRMHSLQVAAKLNKELMESEERWRFALEGAGEGVWDWNVQTDEINYSSRWKEIVGYNKDDSIPDWLDWIHPEDKSRVTENMQAYLDGEIPAYAIEYRLRCKDGSYKWILDRGMVVSRTQDGQPLRMIGTDTDITQRKESEELIWQQANYDPLTQLPNRRMFLNRLDQEIKKSHRTSWPLALMFLDLDRFKEINDTLGHDVGDLLLIEAARRLNSCVRQTDTVARMGGDEFTVILSDLEDLGSVDRIAQHLLQRMVEPFQLGNETGYISASIGVTLFPKDATSIEELLKNADQAMYAAKEQGRNRFNYFTPLM